MPYKPTGRQPGRPKKLPPKLSEKPTLPEHQWKALKLEAKYVHIDEDGTTVRWGASLTRIGRHVGRSSTAVSKWRRDPAYCQGLEWLFSSMLNDRLAVRKQSVEPPRSKRQSDSALHVEIKENWSGPTRSPIDGKVYYDPGSYFRHIQEHTDIRWVGDQPVWPHKKDEA